MAGPIPPFYCVYLLRSSVRHASLYVGSTPNPARRLKEHNGVVAGGAKRTKSTTLRPWEMVVVVSGFTSKIAALQFEWAWQNTHVTRHIAREDRITPMGAAYKTTDRSGRVTTKHRRPALSLRDRLLNLHLLLRVPSFRRWPLRVAFFAHDVYKNWTKWDAASPHKIRPDLLITLEPSLSSPSSTGANQGVEAIDVGYTPIKSYLQKSLAVTKLLEEGRHQCSVCRESIASADGSLFVICPSASCEMVSHLTCLARYFLLHQMGDGMEHVLVPTQGSCPGCGDTLSWSDIVRDLTFRARGQDTISPLLKKIKGKRAKEAESYEDIVAQVLEGLDNDLIAADSADSEGIDKPVVEESTAASKAKAKSKPKRAPRKTKAAESAAAAPIDNEPINKPLLETTVETNNTVKKQKEDYSRAAAMLITASPPLQQKPPFIIIEDSEASSDDGQLTD